ncbi:9799_t:CDS:1, partial [Funneliformis geosporum]
MAIVDHYAGFFEYRVFKNQYAVELLLPTANAVENVNDLQEK